MDAVEKVARFMWDEDWGRANAGDWESALDEEQSSYLKAAERWIDAFPQLALDMRDQWGYVEFKHGGWSAISFDSKDEALAYTGHLMDGPLMHRRNANQIDGHFTTPWSEVQS